MSQKSLELRIAELEDREAIREVLSNYYHGLDKKDEETYLGIWASNAVLNMAEQYGGSVSGEQIREQIKGVWAMLPETNHIGGNAVICIDGVSAEALSDVTATAVAADGTPIISYATYRDKLIKVEGKWKITTRDVLIRYSAPVAEHWNLVTKE